MTLNQVAKTTGLSASLLSQIERGLVDPTVGTFWRICEALDVPINRFFMRPEQQDPVIRREQRKTIHLRNTNVRYHVLTPIDQGKIEFLLVEIEPGESVYHELVSHSGEECGFVMKGELKVLLRDQEYHLYEGDSIAFPSTSPHRYLNPGKEVSLSIWARAT
ncbi:XRE family transcriptional regulator [Brevibacillus humidisoli]|uniref:helix-turn-helix domain-containing protein n=1 Tax=Brevibacillus humidisoli TaxID=2895522 RepID=UPI001E60C01A|nr:XRE family transcriptional regulator [Brevibacillus humidisoli]